MGVTGGPWKLVWFVLVCFEREFFVWKRETRSRHANSATVWLAASQKKKHRRLAQKEKNEAQALIPKGGARSQWLKEEPEPCGELKRTRAKPTPQDVDLGASS